MKRLTVASAVVVLALSALFWGQSSTSSLRGIVSEPISVIPCNSPAWLIFDAPTVRRQSLHKSSSFLRRINLLKFTPHTTCFLMQSIFGHFLVSESFNSHGWFRQS